MRVYFYEVNVYKNGQFDNSHFDVKELNEAINAFCKAWETTLEKLIVTGENKYQAFFKNGFIYDLVVK